MPSRPWTGVVKLALGLLAGLLLGLPAAWSQSASALDAAAGALLAPGEAGRTRALLVQRDGRVLLERYADGFGPQTRFVSWSVAKAVTALAVGLLLEERRLTLDAPAPVSAWRTPGDARAGITLRNLLTMTAGLAHREGATGGEPAHTAHSVRMLFMEGAADTASFATAQPLVTPPGTQWTYSTATTQIIAAIVTQAIVGDAPPDARRTRMAAWFRERLWQPLGITSAEWDFDAAGTFLGCCLLHMTAADYARLGQLLLDDGRAADQRVVVPAAWITALRQPTGAANDNHYGGQIWRNTGPAAGQPPVLFHPRGGADTIAAVGHHGQFVIAVPAKRAVIVRLGQATGRQRGPLRVQLGDLIDAIP